MTKLLLACSLMVGSGILLGFFAFIASLWIMKS